MTDTTQTDVARVFRAEHGRAVAILTRVFGDLTVAEDAVQDAFATALARAIESRACRVGIVAAARSATSTSPLAEVMRPARSVNC